ncbi:eCIS core domain-containing protein [Stutzerimonas degradans]|uniref:eCIS core domain-containing protein n=1 Tax=Stutzerimonas degradans TaxID=2968968 RepID=UPI0037044342
MPLNPFLRLTRGLLTLLVLGSAAVPAQTSCPSGEQPLCLGGNCFCVPGAATDAQVVLERVQQMSALALQGWIQQSRDQLIAAGAEPIPLHLRLQLEPYFDLAVLETARFRVGDQVALDAGNALLRNPDINAVTLIDVIVFRRPADAQDNLALWAHELKHVEQYLEWGVAEFARRYTLDHRAVESPAYALEREVEQALRQAEAQP